MYQIDGHGWSRWVLIVLFIIILVYTTKRQRPREREDFTNYTWVDEFVDQWEANKTVRVLGEKKATICGLMRFPKDISGSVAFEYILDRLGLDKSMGDFILITEWDKYWGKLKKDQWVNYLTYKWEDNDEETVNLKDIFGIKRKTKSHAATGAVLDQLGLSEYNTYNAYIKALKRFKKRQYRDWQGQFIKVWNDKNGRLNGVKPIYQTVFSLNPALNGNQVLKKILRRLKLSSKTDGDVFIKGLRNYLDRWREQMRHKEILNNPGPTYLCEEQRKGSKGGSIGQSVIKCVDITGKGPVMSTKIDRSQRKNSDLDSTNICIWKGGDDTGKKSKLACKSIDRIPFDWLKKHQTRGEIRKGSEPFDLQIDEYRYSCRPDPKLGVYSCQCHTLIGKRDFHLPNWLDHSLYLTPPPKYRV